MIWLMRAAAAFFAGVAFGLFLAPMPTFAPQRAFMPPAVHERPLDLLRLTNPMSCPR